VKAPSTAAKFYAFFLKGLLEGDAERGGWAKNPLTSRAQVFEALEMSWRRMRDDERKEYETLGMAPDKYKSPARSRTETRHTGP
jgi:hypothetical protein